LVSAARFRYKGVVWIFLVAALPLLAQQQEMPVFRSETALGLVHFHVVRKSHYVDNLKPEDVVLLEDGKPRPISLFEGGQTRRTVPVELILLFDTSASVRHEDLLNPLVFKTTLLDGLEHARLSVYGFDSRLRRFCRPTRDPDELGAVFQRVLKFPSIIPPAPELIDLGAKPRANEKPGWGTWLYESIIGAARDASSGPGNVTRILLVFSDGFPTTKMRAEKSADAAKELGIPIYPVVLGHYRISDQIRNVLQRGTDRHGTYTDQARDRLNMLKDKEEQMNEFAGLGEMTGGRSFDPPTINLNAVRQILSIMVAQVQCEYVVGFNPGAQAGQPGRHKLEIKLRSKDLGKVVGGVRTLEY